jgi:Putative zinc-finger
MEGTPLRSVPARLPGPVNPVHAIAQVARVLPDLAPEARRALALVDLGARPRTEAAIELGVAEHELSRLLSAGRKALRRTVAQLPAGGWCERAERLISDRIDGVLAPAGEARLTAHLRGCDRCATHEQRLVQGHDVLVQTYLEAHPPAPAVAPKAAAGPAEVRLVEVPAGSAEARPEAGGMAGDTGDRMVSLRGWRVAFLVGALLALAAVVLALLSATGAVHVT